MFDALLPEVLAIVAVVEVELDRVFVEAVVFRVQFDKELFALEAELANLSPRKRVYLGVVLKHQDSHVRHGQVKLYAFVIFGRVHHDTVELNFARNVQQVEVRVCRRLTPLF